MLPLVFTYRHFVGTVEQDVGSHQHRVAEQAGIDVIGLFARLVLERGGTFELAQIGVHREQQRQFGNLRNIALDVKRSHVGIDSGSQVFRKHVTYVVVQHRRVGMGRKGVIVRDEEEATRLVLHLREVLESAEVVAQMQLSGRANAAKNDIHGENGVNV